MPKNNRNRLITLISMITAIVAFSHAVFAADITPPVTTHTLNPATPNGKLLWYTVPVQVTLNATDLESGVKEINYRVDGGIWQKVSFADSLNLAPNPSFETIDHANVPIIESWTATTQDGQTQYLRDTSTFLDGFETTSAKISSTAPGWHGINNKAAFAVATPLSNMAASAWVKTDSVTAGAFFNVYAVSQDLLGNLSYTWLTSSNSVSGTADWTKLDASFIVTPADAVGVYLDIGTTGPGTVWIDAATISSATTNSTTTFTVATDSTQHSIEYYSVDRANNVEVYSCSGTLDNCIRFKQDQTPPGNWHDSGAFRGLFGSDHELYVYTSVEDPTSGISTFTDKYSYHVDAFEGFGRYDNLLRCNTAWYENGTVILISPPFLPGVKEAYLLTPKTDFCNNNWKVCKTVRFFAEDLAGNVGSKDFCINGPYIRTRGGGIVRADGGINMLADPDEDNTDGVIEVGNTNISYFSSTRDWIVRQSLPPVEYNYDKFIGYVRTQPTNITSLTSTSGVYRVDGDFEVTNASLPNNFNSAIFNQVVFINGDLRISRNIAVAAGSTALFIVKGNVEIAKAVDGVAVAILADGDLYTAYDIAEGDTTSTLTLSGVFSAHKFYIQRTLQGTNNNRYPSESFTYEPKYAIRLRDYLGTNSVKWIRSN